MSKIMNSYIFNPLENGTIEEIFKKQNCKVVAVTDVSLANAIIENAK